MLTLKQLLSLSISLFFVTYCFSQNNDQAATASIIVDGGNQFARKYNVTLELTCPGAYQMMVGTDKNFTGSHWTPFEAKILHWELPRKDGPLTVFAAFRDREGNELGKAMDEITVDATPPANPKVTIEVDNKLTNDPSFIVDLSFQADDAKYMMVSNNHSFFGHRWQLYREEFLDWQLEKGEDGKRAVFVKFRDVAGNVTAVVSDEITVDTQPPFLGNVIIDEDRRFCIMQNQQVELHITARDADFVMVSDNKDFRDGEWKPYQEKMKWTLNGDDGQKIVYVKFKDKSGNESEAWSDEILLDTKPPNECSILIDGGSPITTQLNKLVKLELIAKDADMMMLSNSSSFRGARWQKYNRFIEKWTLQGEQDGLKRVFAKFKDEAGNISAPFHAQINLRRGL